MRSGISRCVFVKLDTPVLRRLQPLTSKRFNMSRLLHPLSFVSRSPLISQTRSIMSLNRPAPPPLPPKEQREFEELQRRVQSHTSASENTEDLVTHPDTPIPIKAEFEGEVNPVTGEKGGPKREPVGRWGEDKGGDWSFKGRVSDF